MPSIQSVDDVLVAWGDRLFYPGNRIVGARPAPKFGAGDKPHRAAGIRSRIAATVRRVPQVMVKVTGGGRDMRAIAAHFRYISKNGRIKVENERDEVVRGKDALHDLAEEWRFGGSLIDDMAGLGQRREAFNIMLSMPRRTNSSAVQSAARAFARTELAGHKYAMVLHDHEANPHVHLAVRAESNSKRRLNPRKADLHRWRETFAEKLRELGIEAEAGHARKDREPEPSLAAQGWGGWQALDDAAGAKVGHGCAGDVCRSPPGLGGDGQRPGIVAGCD